MLDDDVQSEPQSGVRTGLDLDRVLGAAALVEQAVVRDLYSNLYRAGGPSRANPRR